MRRIWRILRFVERPFLFCVSGLRRVLFTRRAQPIRGLRFVSRVCSAVECLLGSAGNFQDPFPHNYSGNVSAIQQIKTGVLSTTRQKNRKTSFPTKIASRLLRNIVRRETQLCSKENLDKDSLKHLLHIFVLILKNKEGKTYKPLPCATNLQVLFWVREMQNFCSLFLKF